MRETHATRQSAQVDPLRVLNSVESTDLCEVDNAKVSFSYLAKV